MFVGFFYNMINSLNVDYFADVIGKRGTTRIEQMFTTAVHFITLIVFHSKLQLQKNGHAIILCLYALWYIIVFVILKNFSNRLGHGDLTEEQIRERNGALRINGRALQDGVLNPNPIPLINRGPRAAWG